MKKLHINQDIELPLGSSVVLSIDWDLREVCTTYIAENETMFAIYESKHKHLIEIQAIERYNDNKW